MGYLPSLAEDVFISYAHIDDDEYPMESQGWVAQLDEDLSKRVAIFLDGQRPSVWRDRDVRNNDDFTVKITARLLRTATFLSIISPSFFKREWCIRELEEFAASAERNFGIKIGEKNRIFKVEKVPLGFDRSKLPPHLQGTGSYRFYGPDPGHEGRVHEYRPKLGVDYAAKYWREMDDLAQDIAMVLRQMQATSGTDAPAPAQGITVYLAETTSDLEDEAKEIRRDLKARGYIVLPEGDLPYRTKDFKAKVMDCLDAAVLSIHLFGKEYGYIPEGQSEKSNAWLQYEYALEHQREKRKFERLLWIPPGLTPSDPRQQRFVDNLETDPNAQEGADLLATKLEDLKSVIHEKLEKLQEPRVLSIPVGTTVAGQKDAQVENPLRIYVICDQLDLNSSDLGSLRKYLFRLGYECILPSKNNDERDALQEHADNLDICDACIIYYGEGSERWFGTKLRELRKLNARAEPIRAKAVYVAPPHSASKDDLQTLEAIVLRGSDDFSGENLSPFLDRLRPADHGEGK
jgi:hypothetical protein